MIKNNDVEIEYRCKYCKFVLTKDQKTCPKCGKNERIIKVLIRDTIKVSDKLHLKTKSLKNGKMKITIERILGDSFFHKTQRWHLLDRLFDHTNDKYIEIIKDKKSGKELCNKTEKLSEHIGYGSDKHRKDKLIKK